MSHRRSKFKRSFDLAKIIMEIFIVQSLIIALFHNIYTGISTYDTDAQQVYESL